jgi:hypothetical protein
MFRSVHISATALFYDEQLEEQRHNVTLFTQLSWKEYFLQNDVI